MESNKIKFPLYVLIYTIILLSLLSLIKTDFKLGHWTLRKVDMFAELKSKPFIEAEIDSFDSTDKSNTSSAGTKDPGAIVQYSDSNENSGLKIFMKALYDLKRGKRKKLRIAYFGDSMIEGDLISQDLRKKLQKQFGGKGVGFVPVTSISAPNRGSVQHTYSPNWKDASFQNSKWGAYPFGFSGHVFYPKAQNCWFKLKGVKEERLKDFLAVKFFYGKADSGQTILVNDTPVVLDYTKPYNIEEIRFKTPQNKVIFNMGSSLDLPVYGASIESELGITLDNYSFRGISGIELSEIPGAYFKTINEKYPYDLIILHYGPNLLFKPELVDFSWFERKMEKTMAHLKKNLPKSSILIIGSADKASRVLGNWQTALGVVPLIHSQQRIAKKYHCAFWNLYEMMGGKNSMVEWADKKPILANKDYTHFNYKGAQKVGNYLFESILQNFNEYENRN